MQGVRELGVFTIIYHMTIIHFPSIGHMNILRSSNQNRFPLIHIKYLCGQRVNIGWRVDADLEFRMLGFAK